MKTSQVRLVLRHHPVSAATVIALSTVASVLAALQPLALQRLVDSIAGGRPYSLVVAFLVGVTVAESVVRAAMAFVTQSTSEKIARQLRLFMIRRLLRAKLSSLEGIFRGELVSRLTADTLLVRQVLATGLVGAYSASLMIGAALFMMVRIDLALTGITFAMVAGASLALIPVGKRMKRANSDYQESLGGLGGKLDVVLSSMRLLRVYSAERSSEALLTEATSVSHNFGLRVARLTALVEPVVGVATQGALLVVLVAGGAAVGQGALTAGELVAFLLYLFMVLMPLGQLMSALVQVQAGRAALQRIAQLQETPLEPSGGRMLDGAVQKSPFMALDKVTYEHSPGVGVYEISLNFPSGTHTALVGPSGAGKSTVLGLLARFYEPQEGQIIFSGENVVDLDISACRSRFHLVEQGSPALATTIRENLLLADSRAPDEHLIQALDRVGLTDLGEHEKNDVLSRSVGNSGTNLSGGEQQRLAWARLLVAPRDVVLLDEPTSSVDGISERLFGELIGKLSQASAVITVAHRLSTVRSADRIVVMDQGRVVAEGGHEELICSCALYREMQGALRA